MQQLDKPDKNNYINFVINENSNTIRNLQRQHALLRGTVKQIT